MRLTSSLSFRGRVPTFFGVTVFTLMTDDAKNMSLMPLIVNGVTHGLAVDGETFVFFKVGFIPALQGSVKMDWIDTC
jgi:hypothetical protein